MKIVRIKNNDGEVEPRRSKRVRTKKKKSFGQIFFTYVDEHILYSFYLHILLIIL